jgi:hypothetical protein
MSTFMSAYLRFGRTSATIDASEGHSYYFVPRTYLF